MKRFLTLVAAVAASMILAAGAHAQFGFLVGLTSSSVKMASSDAISLYHAGLTYKIDLPSGFAIQPAVLYQVKGANVGQLGTATDEDFKVKTGFVEVPLGLQWGPHLAAFRPYVFAEPFVGYRVSSTDRGNESFQAWASQAKNTSGSTTWARCSASPRSPGRSPWEKSRISRESSSPSPSFFKSLTDKS